MDDDEDYHVSGSELNDAAKQLEASQDEDLEELGIIDHDGFGELTQGLDSLAQKKSKKKPKKKSHKKTKGKKAKKGKK